MVDMSETPWIAAGDGCHHVRQVGPVFLHVRFGWGGHDWEANRATARDWRRFGVCHRTLKSAKAAAMRVARRWIQEEAADVTT